MDRFPDKVWVISLKHAAEAAGLGKMGLHRNLIHPKFGNFVLIGAVVTNAELARESAPISDNPCVKCNLCVAACPVGAIQVDGHFDFSACYTHNYREFMGGFTDWAETVVQSRNLLDYRSRVTDAESVSLWQSLSFGAQYKSAYCMAVCPAGEDVVPSFKLARHEHVRDVVQPLREKRETLYVLHNSDAALAVQKKAEKIAKYVGNTLRPTSIANFLSGLPVLFQPGRAKGVTARYHFSFRGGASDTLATVDIRDQRVTVFEGHVGKADVRIVAHGATWLRVLRKEASLVFALLFGRIRVRGRFGLVRDFARCFPE
ncbi:MAG TPA: 4Fe-4S binding protein [Polyangiaceae bacterium]|nr:4Fe-4S binding protein [Polyangiaceae bacterium]